MFVVGWVSGFGVLLSFAVCCGVGVIQVFLDGFRSCWFAWVALCL